MPKQGKSKKGGKKAAAAPSGNAAGSGSAAAAAPSGNVAGTSSGGTGGGEQQFNVFEFDGSAGRHPPQARCVIAPFLNDIKARALRVVDIAGARPSALALNAAALADICDKELDEMHCRVWGNGDTTYVCFTEHIFDTIR